MITATECGWCKQMWAACRCGAQRVMWNTGADDATGVVVSADPAFGDAIVRRDPGHNGGVEYRLPLTALWAITDPPYQRRAVLPGDDATTKEGRSDG